MFDDRAQIAAQNNADWYELMFDAHGRRYERQPAAFVAIDTPPPFHSWVTVTAPLLGGDVSERIAQLAKRLDFVVKDSFCALDLDALRLQPFIEASWIHCERPAETDTKNWRRVSDADELDEWAEAWSDGSTVSATRQFPVSLLEQNEVAIWGRRRNGVIDAGAIANRSADCTGMSNVFGDAAMIAAAWLSSEFGGGRPVVGYEWSDALDEAMAVGFTTVGSLRVCGRR